MGTISGVPGVALARAVSGETGVDVTDGPKYRRRLCGDDEVARLTVRFVCTGRPRVPGEVNF